MNKDAKLYCHWASRGLALHNSGGALLCCHSRTFLKDNNNQQIFWHTHTLDDAWNSPTRQEIQQALSDGIQHPNCNACWDEENVGHKSRRQWHLGTDIDYRGSEDVPLLLDLKLGNICNLKCRTCNPYVSSNWMRDWWEIFDKNNRDSEFQNYEDYIDRTFGTGRASYNDNNDQFWNRLDQWLPHAQYIDIYGAEPMLIHKLFSVLSRSIEQGYHNNQTLHFNTNCTIWNQKYIDILGQFKKVFIDLSIDGLYKHYDYTRHGETWNVIVDNLDRYRQFAQTHRNRHMVSVCITVSLFNIYYLDEIFNYFEEREWHTHFNLAHMPSHVSIKYLPQDVKSVIKEKLTNNNSLTFQQEIKPILEYMNEESDLHRTGHSYPQGVWAEVVRSITELDRLRKENFAETFPEFYTILEPHFKLE
jgi:hypothetical protein